MWELFGFVSAFCFIICGIPQVIQCIKQGHSEGVAPGFMWIWLLGEVALIVYAIFGLAWNIPLLLNAFFCLVVCSIILKYMYYPRKKKNFVLKNLYALRRYTK
jgi:uncharacterized protein with PQ loop repeat